ncbi:MAG: TetR/AcrR family transcriptional regulator, partial [Actinobacteria bacterium]|nr:TetR/AcrR family transcriptional regulator [Actinomycetota bacterium]
MARKSRAEAERTRRSILKRAVEQGSVDGLESLSIGQLATSVGMSKSGVIGHFGSKEQLQLATVEAGIDRFIEEVWQPAAGLPGGLPSLRGLMSAWVSYLRRGVFPGGCFMTAVAIEFDDRPGPVKRRIAEAWNNWL